MKAAEQITHEKLLDQHADVAAEGSYDREQAPTQAMIEAGAAGVHFEDQLSSEKKCGHLGGALPSLRAFVRKGQCHDKIFPAC